MKRFGHSGHANLFSPVKKEEERMLTKQVCLMVSRTQTERYVVQ